jgi:transposase
LYVENASGAERNRVGPWPAGCKARPKGRSRRWELQPVLAATTAKCPQCFCRLFGGRLKATAQEGGPGMAERRYCKNTVPGRQGRGKKYPAKVRAEVVMAMIGTNSICAVARKYGVPESTIRSWVAEEAKKPDGEFAKARAEAAREIAARAALGAKAQVSYLQQRAAENQRAAEIRTKLQQRLDEDARAKNYELGVLLKSEEENLQDAAETGLVIRSAPGTYDRQLTDEERTELEKQLERYESFAMSDKDAAKVTAVLLTVAEKAAALVPKDEGSGQSAAPAVLMERQDEGGQQEVVLDGSGTV